MVSQNCTLAKLRKFLGKSVKEICRILDLPQNTWYSIETGRRSLTECYARRVSDKSGVSASWLLANDREKPPLNDSNQPYQKSDLLEAQNNLGSWSFDTEWNRRKSANFLRNAYRTLRAIDEEVIGLGYELVDFHARLDKFLKRELERFPAVKERLDSKRR
jgi:transcriptional regulator with XRE-family HTH domain